MAAHYDTYDYPSYWKGRDYEHSAEVCAIRNFLSEIPQIGTLLEIGSGYGRLTPTYLHRAKKVILTDPSSKLLNISKKTITDKKVKFIQSKAENLPNKIRSKSVDIIICIRVAHHIKDIDKFLDVAYRLLKPNGYFILEFANKRHLKALVSEFIKGNFTFALDIFPKDITKKKKKTSLPFVNYHPDIMVKTLKEKGFVIKQVRSVSNIRSPFLKQHFSTDTLMSIENVLQKPMAKSFAGPSIFLLAQKRG